MIRLTPLDTDSEAAVELVRGLAPVPVGDGYPISLATWDGPRGYVRRLEACFATGWWVSLEFDDDGACVARGAEFDPVLGAIDAIGSLVE